MFSANASQVSGAGAANYIEDVFSTYLYTGNNSSQTINNGIDLAGKGGLVWIKARNQSTEPHWLQSGTTGWRNTLNSNNTSALAINTSIVGSVTSTGFSDDASWPTDFNMVSWTFRKQPKFFDVVTYTGTGSTQTINHNLGSVPGCILVKATSIGGVSWRVYHRSLGATKYLILNTTDAATTRSTDWNDTEPTSTQFTVGSASQTNDTAVNYVAYLFAHNAGGFGLTGTDNVISCGSFTTAGATVSVTLNYEPQFLMLKSATGSSNWIMLDVMRGMVVGGDDNRLYANSSSAETPFDLVSPTATGFTFNGAAVASADYIYIAIRRGPMKTPTSGTQVFAPVAQTARDTVTTNFPVDLVMSNNRIGSGTEVIDRLRGDSTSFYNSLMTYSTASESTGTGYGLGLDNNTGYVENYWTPGQSIVFWNFRRAPGFFDEVCYTGNGTAGRTVAHNLGVAPEMMIVKARDYSGGRPWPVYHSGMGNTKFMYLNTTDAEATNTWWNNTTPTSTVFTVGSNSVVNFSGTNYVTYLFASCPGVSKVGTYTGNGSTQTINCGFTGGARFVLIKRTDSTGDWYVYDTARGMTTLTDPYLLLNSTAAESATLGSVTTVTTGFAVNASILAAINTNGASYIFLAIA